MAEITVVGAVFVDVKGFPFEKYNPRAKNLGGIKLIHGGVCRNVAENIAGAGERVTFVGMTDHSAVGADVVERLNMAGVDTSYVITVENGLGMWLAIMDETGDIAGQISKMPDTEQIEKIIDEHGDEIFKKADSVIIEFDLGESISEKAIALSRKHNTRLYTVVGNMSVLIKRQDFIKSLRCFICNEAEMGKICKMDLQLYTPEKMLELVKYVSKERNFPAMIVTMGDQGAVYYDRNTGEEGICGIIETKLVDTSGAGDAFLSGAVIGLERNLSLKEACVIGTKMASYVIGIEESSSPDMKEIIK